MNLLNPTVSVIVPNFNGEKVLPLCLEAISRQDYPLHEVVVVDDCSTDRSAEIAGLLGAHVVRTPVNSGVAVARNTGAAAAAGEILFFVDSDVALAPDAVTSAVAVLAADPGIGAVCGIDDPDPLFRDSNVTAYRALQHHYWTRSTAGPVSFLLSAMFAIRAHVFAEIGCFNPALRYTEEVDFGHRLGQRYTLLATPAIHGQLDHDHLLWPLLRKLFHRGRLRMPLYLRKRQFAQGYETSVRAWGSVAALMAVLALPLPVLLGAAWLAAPALLLAASLACDAGMYRFVYRRRGPAFTGFYASVHFLVNLVIVVSVTAGLAQCLVSPRFRALYDVPVPRPADGTRLEGQRR
ncbi:MAG TPA: glycosyltransferase family 2 protein [Streptosporangiaceae bacterium]